MGSMGWEPAGASLTQDSQYYKRAAIMALTTAFFIYHHTYLHEATHLYTSLNMLTIHSRRNLIAAYSE